MAIEIGWGRLSEGMTFPVYKPAERPLTRARVGRTIFKSENKMKKILISCAVVLASMFGVAQAAVDASVTTAVSQAGTDAATLGSAVLVVIVGIYAFRLLRKAL